MKTRMYNKVGKKMNAMKGFMPMLPEIKAMPPMPFMPGACGCFGKKNCAKDEAGVPWDDFKSNVANQWDMMRDMQNSSMETLKEQWNLFFGNLLEMQENFAASLPDELPALPWLPEFFLPSISPRAFVRKMKEFQEMANAHAVEQADSFFDFCRQRQQKVKEMVAEAVENVEAKAEENAEAAAEEDAEVKAEENAEAKAEENTEAKAEEPANE